MRDPRNKDDIRFLRYYLKDYIRQEIYFEFTDQNLGIPMPPVQKYVPEHASIIELPSVDSSNLGQDLSVRDAIQNRMSRRAFSNKSLTQEELSYLLWSVAGVRLSTASGRIMRTVPSAGNRHSIETYLAILNVDGIEEGLYRYLPIEHALLKLESPEDLSDSIDRASLGQGFPGKAPVTFFWSTIPYRTEWRYAQASWKVIALDAGHIGQNLYLAAESIQAGCCVMAAFDQARADELLGLDGEDEFVIYSASVGKQLGIK